MLITKTQSGKIEYGIREYFVDTPLDLESLKKLNCAPGSNCTVISTGDFYIKNSQGKWILQPRNNSGGGSSSGPSDGDNIIYDGGMEV